MRDGTAQAIQQELHEWGRSRGEEGMACRQTFVPTPDALRGRHRRRKKRVDNILPRLDGRPTLGSAFVPRGVGMCPADPSGAVFPDASASPGASDDMFDSVAFDAFASV